MNPKAFSDDGYIIDQSKTEDLPFGVMGSKYLGCSWIAAFNFLKAVGHPVPEEVIRGSLRRQMSGGGLFGVMPKKLSTYLESYGFRFKQVWGKSNVLSLAPQCTAGIIMHSRGSGFHYTAFIRQSDSLYRFFNADFSQQHHLSGMDPFLKRYAKLPIVLLMGWAPRN